LLGDGIAEVQLNYEEAEVEHGASNCEANDCKSVEAICRHAEEGEEDTEFKSKDTTDVTEEMFG
jgi:hypothetical protein